MPASRTKCFNMWKEYIVLVLGITDLHNDMILSTLSISSHGFVLVSPKGLISMEIVFLTIKPMIFLLISQRGLLLSQQSSPLTKYTIEPPLKPMEPSDNLPLIESRHLLWCPRTKYTICSTLESPLNTHLLLIKAQLLLWSPQKYTFCLTLESPLTTSSRLTIFLFDTWGFYWHG